MGKTVDTILLVFAGIVFIVVAARGCSSQSITRSWGGEMEVELEPNQKLVEVTWKESSLWFLTKDMSDDDVAESYRFSEKDSWGMLEGCVSIKEVKLSEEELAEYKAQRQYAYDYYRMGNQDENGEVFIQYNIDTDTYSLIKPYKYGENDELVPAY